MAVARTGTVLCCPGVAPEKLKRTPSLSALDELVMGRDSDQQQQCNVFMLKVCGTAHLCLHASAQAARCAFQPHAPHQRAHTSY